MQLPCGFNTFFPLHCALKVSGSYHDWQSQGKSPLLPCGVSSCREKELLCASMCAELLWYLCKLHLSSGWIRLLKGSAWMLLEEGLSEKEKMALEAKTFPFFPWASLASLLPRYDIVLYSQQHLGNRGRRTAVCQPRLCNKFPAIPDYTV